MPYIQFQHRRGTAATWTSNNPILASGEMGVETDTQLFKIGDGTTAWVSLAYGGLRGYTGPIGNPGPTGPSTNPATWAAYPASTTLNAGGYAITNAASVNGVTATPSTAYVTTLTTNVGGNLSGIVLDSSNNAYVVNGNGASIAKITPAGVVTTLAGNGPTTGTTQNDGTGTNASFVYFRPMVMDASQNIYICDAYVGYGTLRKITLAGVVTTVAGSKTASGNADGVGTNATMYQPWGMTIDPVGSNIYINDTNQSTGLGILRVISLSNYQITTIPLSLPVLGSGQYMGWDATTGTIVTVSGMGGYAGNYYRITTSGTVTQIGTANTGGGPLGCWVDPSGNIYPSMYGGGDGFIYQLTPAGVQSIIAGGNGSGQGDGMGAAAGFAFPWGLAMDTNGVIHCADSGKVRKLVLLKGSGGVLPYSGSLYTSNASAPLTIQAPTSYRYVTSNVTGTTLDLTASSNLAGTTFRLTAGPSNTITFPYPTAARTGIWWEFSNAYGSPQTLSFAGSPTGLPNPRILGPNTAIRIYGNASSYYIPSAPGAARPAVGPNFTVMGGFSTGLSYSYDGYDWSNTNVTSGRWNSVIWNGSMWLAGASPTMMYSSDGITWSNVTSGPSAGYVWEIAWGNGIGVVGGQSGTANSNLLYSTDGLTWVATPVQPFTSAATNVAWNGSMFVAGGNGAGGATMAYSYDGINWVATPSSPFSSGGCQIAWNGRIFVATGNGGNTLAWSSDGVNWNGLGTSVFTTNALRIVWNGSMFMALGVSGSTYGAAYSSNGTTWTNVSSYPVPSWGHLTWNGSTWISTTLGNSSSLGYSSNGSNWTLATQSIHNGTLCIGSRIVLPNVAQGNTIGGVTLSKSGLITGATSSNSIGGVLISNGSINNVSTTPTLYNVSTVAGNGTQSVADGTGTNARIGGAGVDAMVYNTLDSNVYFADLYTCIRKFNPATGVVTTLAGTSSIGSSDGVGTNATFSDIRNLAHDGLGNLYISDGTRIRKYVIATNTVSTVAGNATATSTDGTGTNATIRGILSSVFDPTGSTLYFSDYTQTFRKYEVSTGVVTTISSINVGYTAGSFVWDTPTGTIILFGNASGGNLHRITTSGVLTTLSSISPYANVQSIAVDSVGNYYGADFYGAVIKVSAGTYTLTTIAGTKNVNPDPSIEGLGSVATFKSNLKNAVVDGSGNVYTIEPGKIRKLTSLSGSGGVLQYNGSLYTSNSTTPLTIQAPTSYRYVTSNVSGTTVDLTASSNLGATTFRLTAGPANTITFPALSASTSGTWWSFSNAYTATQTITFAGTTTGLTSPYSLLSNSSLTIYSDGTSYRTVSSGAIPNTINGVTLFDGTIATSSNTKSSVVGGVTLSNGAATAVSSIVGKAGTSWAYSSNSIVGASWMASAASSNGQTIFAINQDSAPQFVVSSNYGVTWVASANPPNGTSYNPHQVGVSGSGSLVGIVSGGGLSRSTDGGLTWTGISTTTMGGITNGNTLFVSLDGTRWVAGGTGTTPLYVSSNSGVAWAAGSSVATHTGGSVMKIVGSSNGNILLATTQVTNLLTSTDGGLNWTTTTQAGCGNNFAIAMLSDGSKMYAAIPNSNLIVSTDYGSSWTTLASNTAITTSGQSSNWQYMAVSSNGSNIALVASGGGIYISSNGGTSWTGTTIPTLPASFITGPTMSLDGTFLTAATGGLFWASSNSGANWSILTGVNTRNFHTGCAVRSSYNGVYVVAGGINGQMLQFSSNSGRSWAPIIGTASHNQTRSIAVSSNGATIIYQSGSDNNLYVSSNYGSTWTVATNANDVAHAGIVMSYDATFMACVGYYGRTIRISSNSGVTWSAIPDAGPGSRTWSGIAMSSNGSNMIAVAMDTSNIYVSSNRGTNWTSNVIAGNTSVMGGACISADATRAYVGISNGPIYVSTDAGNTWTATPSGSSNWQDISCSANGQQVLAAPVGYPILSVDGGRTWTQVTNGTNTATRSAWVSGDASTMFIGDQNRSNALISYSSLALTNATVGGVSLSNGIVNATISNATASSNSVGGVTLSNGMVGGVMIAGGAINNVPTTPTTGATVTFAGSKTVSTTDGTGTAASFHYLIGIAYDPSSGSFYCLERDSGFIRKVTSTAVVTKFAGGYAATPLDGTGTNAKCRAMKHGVCDANGTLYFVDNNLIRKMTSAGAITTIAGVSGSSTYADGTGTNATFVSAYGITIDPTGSTLYITDQSRIRQLTISTAAVTTLIGTSTRTVADGTGTNATCQLLTAIAYDTTTNTIVFSDGQFGGCLRRVTPAGVATYLTGRPTGYGIVDGSGTNAAFYNINGIAINQSTGMIYTADYNTNPSYLRYVTPTGTAVTIAGGGPGPATSADGVGSASSFVQMADVCCDASGTAYVVDMGFPRMAKVSLITGSGGVLPYNGSLYTSNLTTALTVKAPLSYRYSTSNVTGTTVDLTASSNVVSTIFRLTAGPSNTITFPSLASSAGVWWEFSNAYTATQSLTFSGTTTGLSSPYSLLSNTSLKIYSDGTSYRVQSGAISLGKVVVSGSDISNAASIDTIPVISPVTVTTFVGTTGGNLDGIGTNARFSAPWGSCMDPMGNMYIGDKNNNVIRKVTPAGVVTRFAGSGSSGTANGIGTNATFNQPMGITYDSTSGTLIAVDFTTVRRITLAGVVTTIAGNGSQGDTDGTGTNATFNTLQSVVVDPLTGIIYCSEASHCIRSVTQAGVVTLFAGNPGTYTFQDGVGTNAYFYGPFHLATDGNGTLYVADYYNFRVRKIILSTASVTTLAGGGNNVDQAGIGTNANFCWCVAMAYDPATALVYTSSLSGRIMSVSTVTGAVNFFVGTGARTTTVAGVGTSAVIGCASSITIAVPGQTMYFTDFDNNRVCKVALQASFNGLSTPASGSLGGLLLSNSALNTATSINNVPVTQDKYVVTTFAGSGSSTDVDGVGTNASIYMPEGVWYSSVTNMLYTTSRGGYVHTIDMNGNVSTLASGLTNGGLREGITTDLLGNVYLVNATAFNTIGKITPSGVITTIAGDGTGASVDGTGLTASFNNPYGLICDPSGTYLYVSDASSHVIRQIVISSGVVTTIAGSGSSGSADGVGTNASFSTPVGLGIDATGGILYISGGGRIRKLTIATGVVTTLAGSGSGYADGIGTNATLNTNKIVVDPVTGNLFGCGNFGAHNPIRKITPTGVVTTIAGSSADGYADGVGTNAIFASPSGIAVDTNGLLYIADNVNNRIRKITPTAGIGGVFLNGGSITATGTTSVQQIQETLNTIASPGSGTVVANWSMGAIWYVTSMTANFTINLTNLPTVPNKSYSVVFTLVQGATPYYISAFQIAGVAQTIKWSASPSPQASHVDTETFTLMYTGGAWTVLGQLTSFG